MLLALRHPRLWLVSGWILIVLAVIASLVPAHDLPSLGGISDKTEHMVGYAVLAFDQCGFGSRMAENQSFMDCSDPPYASVRWFVIGERNDESR